MKFYNFIFNQESSNKSVNKVTYFYFSKTITV